MGFPYPYPLGLPKGTVRASLTISVSVNLLFLTYYDMADATAFSSVVAVALAFYFGGRIRGGDPSDKPKTAAERAFALPAGTVRSFLIIMFAGFSGYLLYTGAQLPRYLLEVISLIAGYIFGVIFRHIFHKDKSGKVSLLQHLKSILAIAITALSIYMSISLPGDILTNYAIQGASLFLGFYFGSRD